MNKLKRIAAGMLALTICLSVAGCGNKKKSDDTNSQAVSGVAVQDHDKQAAGSNSDETGTSAVADNAAENADAEKLYAALKRLYRADGIHANIQSTITLHTEVGTKSNDVTTKSNIEADVTPTMTHAIYVGSDLYGDSSRDVTYDIWSDYKATRTYSNRYTDPDTKEAVWKYTNGTVFSPADFDAVIANFSNAASDGDVITCDLKDLIPPALMDGASNHNDNSSSEGTGMENGYGGQSIFTEDSEGNKYGIGADEAEPQLETITFDETTLEAFRKSVPTDVKRYLERNYYMLDGQIKYQLSDGKLVGIQIDKATKVLADTNIGGDKAVLTLEFSLNMTLDEMTAEAVAAVAEGLPNQAKSADKAEDATFTDSGFSDIYSGNAATIDVAGLKFDIPSDAYVPLENYGVDDTWSVIDTNGSKMLTTNNYPGVVVSLITNAYGQYSSATVDNLSAYIDADNARTNGTIVEGNIDTKRFPELKLTLNGVNFKWGMTDAEILAVLGEPTTIVELDANRVFDDADLSGSNMVYSVTSGDYIYVISFNVYNKYGLQSYTVTATPKY